MKRIHLDSITTPPDGKPQEQQPRWRQDFPIDISKDEYVSRREFTKFMVLISFSFVAGQAWILLQNLLRRSRGKLPLMVVASLSEIGVGQVKVFNYPGEHEPCILVRIEERNFIAYSQKCTHLSCPVIPDVSKKQFHCPCHEGYFEMETGTPFAGPPRRPLARIHLKIHGDKIYAAGHDHEQPVGAGLRPARSAIKRT